MQAAFAKALFAAEGAYTDVYWQQPSEGQFMPARTHFHTWMLRGKAAAMHGGGSHGHQGVQTATGCGVCELR